MTWNRPDYNVEFVDYKSTSNLLIEKTWNLRLAFNIGVCNPKSMQYQPTKSQRCFNGEENTFYQIEIWLDQNTLHCWRYFNLRSTSEYRVNINVTLLTIFQSLFNVEMPAEYQRHIALDISIYVQRRHIELISTYIAADISISAQRRNVAIISRSHCCRYFNIRSTLGCVGGLPNINVALLTRFKLSFYVSYWWISGPGLIH